MKRIFWGFCINRFLINPLHYFSRGSDFVFKFAEIFVIENRLPNSGSRQDFIELSFFKLLASNWIFVCKSVWIFRSEYEANYVNKWCEYTETCEYEVKKIQIRLDLLQKSCEFSAPYFVPAAFACLCITSATPCILFSCCCVCCCWLTEPSVAKLVCDIPVALLQLLLLTLLLLLLLPVRVSSKQTKINFGWNRNNPKQDLFCVCFGLYRETKNKKFGFVSVNETTETNRSVS